MTPEEIKAKYPKELIELALQIQKQMGVCSDD
jgi:hypothetical protein